jgi:rhamnulose-1-phosphate aldolase/alcohol dehydrogenase
MKTSLSKIYKHVDYLWDEQKALAIKGDEVALLIYRSNLLGADLRLTNYAGGNTSVKVMDNDPFTGEQTEIMWVKGSGGDLGTLKKSGLAALYMDRLQSLKSRYRGLEFEDEMVALFNHCIYDFDSKAPSIDTPLHAFIPYKHIDHLHPDAIIAIAAAKDGKKITHELFEGKLAWVDWQRPGFDLGLKLEQAITENPDIEGIILGGHGFFTWGNTAYESYINTLDTIEKASVYLQENYGKKGKTFGGKKIDSLPKDERLQKASEIMPFLRGLTSSFKRTIGHFTDDEKVLEFINSHDLERLGAMGTSCPDHFLRTKIRPLILNISSQANLNNGEDIVGSIKRQFEAYREDYKAYYNRCKHQDSPAIRDTNPVIILFPGVGMFSFAKDKHTARVASEFYINAINVMKGAEAISEYQGLSEQEAFNIEYWLLEEAKLQRMPKEKPLSRKIALITGASGGIGFSIAKKLAEEGACIILTDLEPERLHKARKEMEKGIDRDTCIAAKLDVTSEKDLFVAFNEGTLAFGGIDILVNCAGISISKSITDTSKLDWEKLMDILAKGQFFVSQRAIEIMRSQGLGGDIINIVSKNALMAGPNNAAYGSAKAAQLHLSRLMAAELGPDKIRVNVVNPDAVIKGSKIWEDGWAEGRAKAYNISIEELPAYYAKRTVLNEEILTEDIANAVFVFVSGLLSKSTGNVLNVDGGIPAVFVR